MNNYERSRDRAQAYFLRFDQAQIAESWQLSMDDRWLYVTFLGADYQIHRRTGSILRRDTGEKAGFSEVLSIFDLLCHEGESKYLSGNYAPVNSLKHRPRAIGVDSSFYTGAAAAFDRDLPAFQRACFSLGGIAVPMGDMGFRFPIFGDLSVILKFYRADEDFPASVTLLWDENTLLYIYYETVFYIAGFLLERIREEMER